MKLASTTLTGNNQESIGDALRSVVDWVDSCIVIDTGVTDASLDIAADVAGDKLIVERFEWVSDFAKARNFALDAAHRHGAHWALTLDTDERIVPNGEDLRKTIFETTVGVVLMPDKQKNYVKERVIRLPSPVRFSGPTHEAFASAQVGTATTERAYFWELPKDAEASRKKFERDLDILQADIRQHAENPRSHYYLGDSLKNLGRFREAITAYARCTALRGWDEESAWACFRAAQCHEELGEYRQMLDVLALGMARHAGLAELPWYAGVAAQRLGQHQQAIYWSRLALTWGHFEGRGATVKRIGFRHPAGLYEGPYDVLRFSLKALGDAAGAQEAESKFHQAKEARESR